MGKATGYYREQCARYGWEPGPDDIIYRANMMLGRDRRRGRGGVARRDKQAPFPVRAGLRDALLAADTTRNIAGEKRPANVGGVLPISFCGGPDRVVEQIRRCREEIGAGVIDLSLQDPGAGDVDAMMGGLELFGKKVLPRIREILRARNLLLPLMPLRRGRASRRRLLLAAMAAGAAFGLTAAPAAAQQQLSQEEADYRDRPKSGLSCAACALFRPPRACVVVAGDISPNGWRKFFDLPD